MRETTRRQKKNEYIDESKALVVVVIMTVMIKIIIVFIFLMVFSVAQDMPVVL